MRVSKSRLAPNSSTNLLVAMSNEPAATHARSFMSSVSRFLSPGGLALAELGSWNLTGDHPLT